MKRCSACKVEKPAEAFNRDTKRPDGLQYTCKECKRARSKADYWNNRERRIASQMAYYERNKELVRANARKNYHRYRERNSRASRERNWLVSYGLTPEAWEALFESQGRTCAACGSPTARGKGWGWHVDHCHETGQVRSILCNNCNSALGMIGDCPERVLALYKYLLKHV